MIQRLTRLFGKLHREKQSSQQLKKDDWNKRLVSRIVRRRTIPNFRQFKKLPSLLEQSDKQRIKLLLLIMIFAGVLLGVNFYRYHNDVIPDYGGEYIEGVIGQPQFINPVLAGNNEVDADLAVLIYSSLLKFNERRELIPDIAESYQVSEDFKEYTFQLKKNILWHDGESLTVNDVVFTVETIKNSQYLSPLQTSFRGVSVERKDESTIKFILTEPYAPFINSLTFGILPQHKWGDVAAKNFSLSKLNLEPIGSGPFKASSFKRDDLGDIRSYTVERYNDYYGERAYLEKITLKFYNTIEATVNALENKNIMGMSVLPREYRKLLVSNKNVEYHSLTLPQYTALFFNLRDSVVLKDTSVRQALAMGINRPELVLEVFGNDALVVNSPILPGHIGYQETLKGYEFDFEAANKLLDDAGWIRITPLEYLELIEKNKKKLTSANQGDSGHEKFTQAVVDQSNESMEELAPVEIKIREKEELEKNELLDTLKQQVFYRQRGESILELNITTVDHPENQAVTDLVKKYWSDLGVRVDIFTVDVTKVNTEVIQPRLYDVLLYGEIVGSDPDPYPYWHSSQISSVGLNLSLFSHKKIDKILEEGRRIQDIGKRAILYQEFQDIIVKDVPAIFLYYPRYTYVTESRVHNVLVSDINLPSDRFADITKRSVKTKKIIRWYDWKNWWKQ